MTTQLALEITETAPPQGPPITEQVYVCPVRDKCLLAILAKQSGYRCGFEQAGTVGACPKRRRLEG